MYILKEITTEHNNVYTMHIEFIDYDIMYAYAKVTHPNMISIKYDKC